MSIYLVATIAKFEIRTLLRSWFFRIFVGLVVFGLGMFNVAMNIEQSGAPWIYKALAVSIPYANLIILNLGQAIVAVFLASEFLKQDKKNDSVEVIYVRSISNFEYILGKTLGILSVFIILNILVLLIGTGFSFLNNTSSTNFFAYLVYPLLISLPTLIFVFGLSFFLMVIIKNQAVTFILLLGYIALTIFYLNQKAFHVFDFIAYSVPMMYSSITGFSNLNEIILHRGIYFLIGIGLILLTVYKLHRLPQKPRLTFIPLVTGICFLIAGGFCISQYISSKQNQKEFKKQYIALNNQYASKPQPLVKNCDIDLIHNGETISVVVNLEIHNQHLVPLDTLIFSLNPSLLIKKITLNNSIIPFTRKSQLVLVSPVQPLDPGQNATLQIEYDGTIDESIGFLDYNPEEYQDIFKYEVFTFRKRFSFLQDDFVCLTNESLWYPISGVGYSSSNPMRTEQDLIHFTLKVKTNPALTVISQGLSTYSKNGITEFKNEFALPKISLLIGNYTSYHIKVDSIDYALYTIKGNDYYKSYFTNIADTLPQVIRSLKQEYELNLGLKYPFKRFSLAEVPLNFSPDNHKNSGINEAIQPEMVFYSEKGIAFSGTDFRNRIYRIKEDLKSNKEEALPEEIQIRMFRSVIQNNLLEAPTPWDRWRSDSYSVFPLFYTYVMHLQADKLPILNAAFEAYFKNRNYKNESQFEDYPELRAEEKVNIELESFSLAEILKQRKFYSTVDESSISISEIVLYKGKHLFDLLRAKYGEKELDTLLTGIYLNNLHQKTTIETINASFRTKFNLNFDSLVHQWMTQKTMPSFRIQDITTYKVVEGEKEKYQVRLKVTNTENADGLITLNFELNSQNKSKNSDRDNQFNVDFSRKVYVPAKSSLEIGYTFNTEPTRMMIETHVSKNLPCLLNFYFSGFTETRRTPALDGANRIEFLAEATSRDEIIVDNEDKGFSFNQLSEMAYLKSIIRQKNSNLYKYDRIRWWNPPHEWKPILSSKFHGNTIHSALYTKGSDGNQIATWKTLLPGQGEYEVYFYLNKFDSGWGRDNKPPDYNFVVYHDGGAEKVMRNSKDMEEGWVLIGTYIINSDTAKVQLTNKSAGNIIIADAVKWVKIK